MQYEVEIVATVRTKVLVEAKDCIHVLPTGSRDGFKRQLEAAAVRYSDKNDIVSKMLEKGNFSSYAEYIGVDVTARNPDLYLTDYE